MKNHIRFSKNERNGLLLFFFIVMGWSCYVIFIKKDQNLSKDPIRLQRLEQVVKAMEQQEQSNYKREEIPKNHNKTAARTRRFDNNSESSIKNSRTVERFMFDPNSASLDTLILLGLSPYAARNLVKYRDKGGVVKKASDLKKIYGISEADYRSLESFVSIKSGKSIKEKKEEIRSSEAHPINLELIKDTVSKAFRPIKIMIDINGATEEEWQKLFGIGPTFAARIVKYRSGLGGFHKRSQLREVYGFPDSTYQQIKDQLVVKEVPELQKIFINQTDYERLKKHYYIDYQLASILINYRTQHGPYKKIEDLMDVKVVTSEFIEKIGPYLDFSIN